MVIKASTGSLSIKFVSVKSVTTDDTDSARIALMTGIFREIRG